MSCNKEPIFIFKISFRSKTFILEMHVVSLNNVLDNVKNAISHINLGKQAQANARTDNLKKLVIKLLHV